MQARGKTFGKRFGRLVVIGFKSDAGRDKFRAICKCDCGHVKNVDVYSLLRKDTRSCGCLNAELLSKRRKIHGASKTYTYNSWYNMIYRCASHKCRDYHNYGGRGIKVCERWLDFKNFLADMGPRPPKRTIDRIDPNGNYCPENCQWADSQQQARSKRTNRFYELNGEKKILADWAAEFNITFDTLSHRIRKGKTIQEAISGSI